MNAQKVTVTIKVTALATDAVPALIYEAYEIYREKEAISGSLEMEDGDKVSWKTRREDVTF